MRKLFFFLLLSFVILSEALAVSISHVKPDFILLKDDPQAYKLARFLAIADSLRQQAGVPGVGLAIVYQGEIAHVGGMGYQDLAKKRPVSENTLFMIGSTTKAFTGVVAGRLVDRGLLDWKKPIINYLPGFTLSEPYIAQHLNIEDAFTHMTGLARKDELWHGQPLSRKQIFKQVETMPFAGSFRGEWAYNNHMYVVAGTVLEEVGRKSWEELVTEEIFSPLEMSSSHVSYKAFMKDSHAATGYQEDGLTIRPHINVDNIGPAGAISSSPKDIGNWLMMMVNKGFFEEQELLQPETFDYLTEPKSMSLEGDCSVKYYSIGWGASKNKGKRYLRHSGAIAGQNAVALVMPEDDFGVFIMTNQRSDYKEILTDYAENIFLKNDFSRNLLREDELISKTYFIRLRNTLLDYGIEAARAYHATIPNRNYESLMNELGYALLGQNHIEAALLIFELNTEDQPISPNAFDSYGEALLKAGEQEKAISVYKRALELDPELTSTILALKSLGEYQRE